jgi:hypothetical protein
MKDPLDDALGLPPLSRGPANLPDPTLVDDYEHARANLIRLAAKAEHALDELGEVAEISQHPRAYEVYANLMKTTVDANKELLALKKANKEIEGGPSNVTNHNNLIMTSEEVLKMIKGKTIE